MTNLDSFIAHEVDLKVTEEGVVAVRAGARAVLKDKHENLSLARLLANRLPYHYRTVHAVVEDFALGAHALESTLDIAANAATSPKYQQSHAGEILASTFVEERLGFKRLYSKLTLTTSQNTNVHKMDGLFVDVSSYPYKYLFVEAKASILPTAKSQIKSHRSGILKQMLDSLETYGSDDPRFELTRIRDNLDKAFCEPERSKIRNDMMPPGPPNLKLLGISVTNAETVNAKDDNFILSAECSQTFDYKAIVVTNLSELASKSYGVWEKIKAAADDV